MDRKLKMRVINKLLDAGFDDEKKIIGFGMKDMLVCDIRGEEIGVVIELQAATKNHKVISFLADEEGDEVEGGDDVGQSEEDNNEGGMPDYDSNGYY